MEPNTKLLVIDGQGYKVTGLPTSQALDLYDELRVSLGDVVYKSVVAAMAGKGDDDSKEAALVLQVVFGALQVLPRGMVKRLGDIFRVRTVAVIATTGAVQQIEVSLQDDALYEGWFARPDQGRGVGHWNRWVLECLKFQFADFLPSSASSKSSSLSSNPGSASAAPTTT